MARQKCTFNGKTKVNVTFKWQDKSLRLNGKTKVYVKMARLKRLNGQDINCTKV